MTSGLSAGSGGPTRSVKGLCRALSRAGADVTLLVLSGCGEFEDPCGVKVERGIAPDAIPDFVKRFALVHLHGLWHPGLHRVASACRKAGVPYVVSPRGMLDPWALSVKKWKKRLALLVYQRADLKHAAAFHATAPAEAEHIRAAGFAQPCILSPNAVEPPDAMPEKAVRTDGIRTALFLSRLHPGKGLPALADAWAAVRPQGWRMRVVGPDSYGHKREVVARLEKLGIAGEWDFVGEVDDTKKWREYRSADLLVHPSVSENFGITIAEGLAAGLPVIATKGTPWAELETRRCGWWIDAGVASLAAALRASMALSDEERNAMGERGQALIAGKYTWPAAAKLMLQGYRQMLGKDMLS